MLSLIYQGGYIPRLLRSLVVGRDGGPRVRVAGAVTRLRAWDDRDPCSVLGGHRSDPACLGSLTSTNHAAVPPLPSVPLLPSLCGMVHGADSGRMQVCGAGTDRWQVPASAVVVSATLRGTSPTKARPRVMRRGSRLGRGGPVCAWAEGARVARCRRPGRRRHSQRYRAARCGPCRPANARRPRA